MEFSRPTGAAFAAPRRVFTAPTQSNTQPHASSSRSADGSVDTLYDHPSVKIVAFTAGPRPIIGPRPGLAPQDVEPGTLSWSTQFERTIAVGPFRIYRAPGSVAFLSCGSALQPILPKSQVWCVEESSSKFVLQIRRPQYWRIELPVGDIEDAGRAQLLREVLDKILQFEKTECPFKRSFTVDLPEPPSTPIKKRPWTPVRKPSMTLTLPPTPVTPGDGRAKRAESPMRPSTEENCTAEPTKPSPEEVTEQENTEATGEPQQQDESPTAQAPARPKVAELRGFYSSRCVTAPPHLMLESGPQPSEAEEPAPTEQKADSPESQNTFHSSQSFLATPPLPPSPPQSVPQSPVGSPCAQDDEQDHTNPEDRSDITVASTLSQEPWSVSPTTSALSESSECATALSSVCDVEYPSPCDEATPIYEEPAAAEPITPSETLQEDHPLRSSISNLSLSSSLSRSSSTSTTRRPNIRHRATTSSSISPSRRALSPLPPAVNLFSPRPTFKPNNAKNTLAVVRRLPMAVIQKTCEILMSPPSHLISLMLNVAARIAAGEWRGLVFGVDERGEQIPVQWDWSEEEDNAHQPSYLTGGMGRFIDEDWPPRGAAGRRMAGSFPESDDEEEWNTNGNGSEGEEKGESDWSRSLGVD
ncbi:inheritance of peroxisomes protein 1-domain-containing protein [Immersiella caudata]|uniref:Inheritance of peroxisomes protein 1 n=1 Tax=Immersiella caudata TaxID=314043 RepID=A0AA39U2L4_9PEZI|nr:inheritance of peroxisomes protein 1-domain-containing protein [Immersiella caudata]